MLTGIIVEHEKESIFRIT